VDRERLQASEIPDLNSLLEFKENKVWKYLEGEFRVWREEDLSCLVRERSITLVRVLQGRIDMINAVLFRLDDLIEERRVSNGKE
jgi:hypothetical protein